MPVFEVNWIAYGAALIDAADKDDAKAVFKEDLSSFLGEWDDYQIDEVMEVAFDV